MPGIPPNSSFLDEIRAGDSAWFLEHPFDRWRVRPAAAAEWAASELEAQFEDPAALGCERCAKWLLVFASPSRRYLLRCFVTTPLGRPQDLWPHARILLAAATDAEFARVISRLPADLPFMQR